MYLESIEYFKVLTNASFLFYQNGHLKEEMSQMFDGNKTNLLQTSDDNHILSNVKRSTQVKDVFEKLNSNNNTLSRGEELQFEPCSDWLISFWNRLLIFIFYQVQNNISM